MGEFNGTAQYFQETSVQFLDSASDLECFHRGKLGDFPFTSHTTRGSNVLGIDATNRLVNYGQSPGAFGFDSYDAVSGAVATGSQEQAAPQALLDADRLTNVGAAILNFLD